MLATDLRVQGIVKGTIGLFTTMILGMCTGKVYTQQPIVSQPQTPRRPQPLMDSCMR